MKSAGELIDKIAFKGSAPKAGDYIKAQRKILNLTQDELAFITGINTGNLSAYENNKKEIGIKTSVKLGTALGLDPIILLESSIQNFVSSKDIKEIKARSKKIIKMKAS